jgi:hypothetical protein
MGRRAQGLDVARRRDGLYRAYQNPRVFAGFNSLGELCNFVDGIDKSGFYGDRAHGWDYSYGSGGGWHGSPDMRAALHIAREGWPEGVEKAKQALDVIETDHPTSRQRSYSVAGGRVNVGKMLSGNPLHMTHRTRQPARKVITLFVELVMSHTVENDNAIIRAASIAAMCDQLEHAEYSCEIIGVMTFSRKTFGPALAHFTVKLKQAGEALNLNDLVFALGHPSMLRRLGFALMAINPALERYWGTMGKIDHAFTDDHPTDTSAFYIGQLLTHDQKSLRGTFADKVRGLFPLIVPDNFPVTLK